MRCFAVILVNLAAAYAMNVWNRNIFDALEKKDAGAILMLSGVYVVILVISVVFAVVQVYARMTLQRRWRQWLTDNLVDRWLKNGRYYQLNLVSGDHKNPEYRIADDVRIATESAGRFRHRRHLGVPVGGNLHRRAVDHRRLAQSQPDRPRHRHPGIPGGRGCHLRGGRVAPR